MSESVRACIVRLSLAGHDDAAISRTVNLPLREVQEVTAYVWN